MVVAVVVVVVSSLSTFFVFCDSTSRVLLLLLLLPRIHEVLKGTDVVTAFLLLKLASQPQRTACVLRLPTALSPLARRLNPNRAPAPGRCRRRRRRGLQSSGRRAGGGGFGREGEHGWREEGDADQDLGGKAQGAKRSEQKRS